MPLLDTLLESASSKRGVKREGEVLLGLPRLRAFFMLCYDGSRDGN